MTSRTQAIRPSQFILTYGPGAIIEGREGPRLIPMANIGLFGGMNNLKPSDYEISDSRMSQGVLNGARVFRLPSNAELEYDENTPIYRTKQFPNWNLCVNATGHRNNGGYVLYTSNHDICPECGTQSVKNKEAVRFIVACPNGHMDDFNWNYFVHGSGSNCTNKNTFSWIGGGSSLANIHLKCVKCGEKSKTLNYAYIGSWKCSGRKVHEESINGGRITERCEEKAKIIQRQASNLRVPDNVALFTIPPRDTALHRMLSDRVLMSHISLARTSGSLNGNQDLERLLNSLVHGGFIKPGVVTEILKHDWNDITSAMSDLEGDTPHDYGELILEEFTELHKASMNGAPPVGRRPNSEALFKVDLNMVVKKKSNVGFDLVITPIERLSEVVVQKSFHREVRSEIDPMRSPSRIDTSFVTTDSGRETWYPGLELHGEGVFVSTENGTFPINMGESYDQWKKAFDESEDYDDNLFRAEVGTELHPLFVYLHTLSHAVIRSISIQSGYSSSAIRERIYVNTNGANTTGGFLIYSTEPGADGTSGGLIAQVPQFDRILDSAISMIETCSNDPLCSDVKFKKGDGRVNGSSCYGCILISETSCEHRNMWLDRNVVMESV